MHFDCAGSHKTCVAGLGSGIFLVHFHAKLNCSSEMSMCISTAQARAKRCPPDWRPAFFLGGRGAALSKIRRRRHFSLSLANTKHVVQEHPAGRRITCTLYQSICEPPASYQIGKFILQTCFKLIFLQETIVLRRVGIYSLPPML